MLSCEDMSGSQQHLITCTAMQSRSTHLGAGSCRMQVAQRQGQGQEEMVQAPVAVAALLMRRTAPSC